MAGIKKNFFYNMILTVGNYIFPLLTYPYVSRVLGASNIGAFSYSDAIIDYFILFASLGIISFGVREIARVKNNPEKRNQIFSTLLFLNILLSFLAIAILIVAVNVIPKLFAYKPYLFVGITKIAFSALLIEWLYQGLSEFKYITIRSIVVRSLFVISVFCFVRDAGDTLIYYLLICLTVFFNAILNLWQSRKYVCFRTSAIKIGSVMIPVLVFGLYKILTAMYTSFNIIYLGSVSDDTQVGYYYTATKLHGIIMSVITAFTTVMIPKVSEMLEEGEFSRLKEISLKTFEVIFALTLPIIVFSFFYAPLIIEIIAGKGYEGAIMPFRIVMVLLLIISIEQVLVTQFLMALRNSNCILVLCLVGSVVGVSFNILLTGKYFASGSAISWMISEIAVMIVAILYFRKNFDIKFPFVSLLKNIVLSLPYVVICLVMWHLPSIYSIVTMLLMFVWFLLSNMYFQKNSAVGNWVISICKKRFCA